MNYAHATDFAIASAIFVLVILELNVWRFLPRAATKWRAWRRAKAYRADVVTRAVEHFEKITTLKAPILSIGTIEETETAIMLGEGWGFDCSNGTPVQSIGSDGQARFCGYTRAELLEISKRPAEYVDR